MQLNIFSKMRNIFFYSAIIALCFVLNSCCHKKYCSDFAGQFVITLYNFAQNDVDSISVEVFEIGPTGKVRIDSVFTQPYQSTSGSTVFTAYVPATFEQNYDYRVTLNSTNQVYLLSGFTTQRASCNNCFIKLMNDDYTTLLSYTVNGMIQYYQDLRIMN